MIPTPYYYEPLFQHMADNHGLTLTDSEMDEICRVVVSMQEAQAELEEFKRVLNDETCSFGVSGPPIVTAL